MVLIPGIRCVLAEPPRPLLARPVTTSLRRCPSPRLSPHANDLGGPPGGTVDAS